MFFFTATHRIVKESFAFPTVFVVYHVRFLPLAIVASNELLRYLVSVLSSIFLFHLFSSFLLVLAANESHCPSILLSPHSRQNSP